MFYNSLHTARAAFRERAQKANLILTDLRFADGEAGTICVAASPGAIHERAVVHISGVHGVEGVVGSAVQLAILDRWAEHRSELSHIFVHILNPWGMQHVRKANSGNVDLNRNFIFPPQRFESNADDYARLDSFLNPATIGAFDFFYLKAVGLVARYGMPAMRQAVAGGQYRFPNGIFYGGRELAAESKLLIDFLRAQLAQAKLVGVIDVHSGLGNFGFDSLLVDAASNRADFELLEKKFPGHVSLSEAETSVAYVTSGGLTEAFPRILEQARVLAFVQEFGTYSALKVLRAMREENCEYQRARREGQELPLTHKSKAGLLAAFCPLAEEWRSKVVERGLEVFNGLSDLISGVIL